MDSSIMWFALKAAAAVALAVKLDELAHEGHDDGDYGTLSESLVGSESEDNASANSNKGFLPRQALHVPRPVISLSDSPKPHLIVFDLDWTVLRQRLDRVSPTITTLGPGQLGEYCSSQFVDAQFFAAFCNVASRKGHSIGIASFTDCTTASQTSAAVDVLRLLDSVLPLSRSYLFTTLHVVCHAPLKGQGAPRGKGAHIARLVQNFELLSTPLSHCSTDFDGTVGSSSWALQSAQAIAESSSGGPLALRKSAPSPQARATTPQQRPSAFADPSTLFSPLMSTPPSRHASSNYYRNLPVVLFDDNIDNCKVALKDGCIGGHCFTGFHRYWYEGEAVPADILTATTTAPLQGGGGSAVAAAAAPRQPFPQTAIRSSLQQLHRVLRISPEEVKREMNSPELLRLKHLAVQVPVPTQLGAMPSAASRRCLDEDDEPHHNQAAQFTALNNSAEAAALPPLMLLTGSVAFPATAELRPFAPLSASECDVPMPPSHRNSGGALSIESSSPQQRPTGAPLRSSTPRQQHNNGNDGAFFTPQGPKVRHVVECGGNNNGGGVMPSLSGLMSCDGFEDFDAENFQSFSRHHTSFDVVSSGELTTASAPGSPSPKRSTVAAANPSLSPLRHHALQTPNYNVAAGNGEDISKTVARQVTAVSPLLQVLQRGIRSHSGSPAKPQQVLRPPWPRHEGEQPCTPIRSPSKVTMLHNGDAPPPVVGSTGPRTVMSRQRRSWEDLPVALEGRGAKSPREVSYSSRVMSPCANLVHLVPHEEEYDDDLAQSSMR